MAAVHAANDIYTELVIIMLIIKMMIQIITATFSSLITQVRIKFTKTQVAMLKMNYTGQGVLC